MPDVRGMLREIEAEQEANRARFHMAMRYEWIGADPWLFCHAGEVKGKVTVTDYGTFLGGGMETLTLEDAQCAVEWNVMGATRTYARMAAERAVAEARRVAGHGA